MAVDWYKDEYLNIPKYYGNQGAGAVDIGKTQAQAAAYKQALSGSPFAMVGSQVAPTPTPASYNPMANDMFKPASTQIANNPSTQIGRASCRERV